MSNEYKTGEWVKFDASFNRPQGRHQISWSNHPAAPQIGLSDFKGLAYCQTWRPEYSCDINWIYVYPTEDLPPIPEEPWSHDAGELGVITIVEGELCIEVFDDEDGAGRRFGCPLVSSEVSAAWDTYFKKALDALSCQAD